MFLLTEKPDRARIALRALAANLPIHVGPSHEVAIGEHTLLWARAQVRDNLHVHPDGIFIGRLRASESPTDDPIVHSERLGTSYSPALPGVVIRYDPRLIVEPIGITGTFVCGSTVSDRQLLLAAHDQLLPGPAGVAMLAGVGWFTGDATLFDQVRRIPFLERWDVANRSGTRTRTLRLPRPDDVAMVDRLVDLVPTDTTHALGMSGGYDSRFMLGILQRAGADLRLVRFTDAETDIVNGVARDLGLEVQGIGPFDGTDGQRPPYEHTLMTDAQIWHGVAQHGRLRSRLTSADLYHSGQFSGSMNKNVFKTAWKIPDPRRPFWDRLIEAAFLPNAPTVQPTLRTCARREELAEVVHLSLRGQRDYVDFRTKKQWANWLHYLNRAMRWSQAFYDDLTFSTNLVYLLSDVDAQLLGNATTAWTNFHHDRIADLNHRLLPEVTTPYSDGRPARPVRGLRRTAGKVEYEYLDRFRTSRAARASLDRIPTTYVEALPEVEPAGFDKVFDRPMHEVAEQGKFGLRRANVTVAHVLTFLEGVERHSLIR